MKQNSPTHSPRFLVYSLIGLLIAVPILINLYFYDGAMPLAEGQLEMLDQNPVFPSDWDKGDFHRVVYNDSDVYDGFIVTIDGLDSDALRMGFGKPFLTEDTTTFHEWPDEKVVLFRNDGSISHIGITSDSKYPKYHLNPGSQFYQKWQKLENPD